MKKKSLSVLIAVAMATTTFAPSAVAFADEKVAVTDTANAEEEVKEAPASTYGVTYDTHIQKRGWNKSVKTVTGDEADITKFTDAGTSGTIGKALRVEAIKISGTNLPEDASIEYKVHQQTFGWSKVAKDGAEAGVTGKGKRAEAIKVTLKGLPGYAIKYQVHVQKKGWMPAVVTENETDIDEAAIAGTEGQSLRIEAVRVQIVKTDAEKKAEVEAINAVAKAEASKTQEDVDAANKAIANVQDTKEKKDLEEKVAAIEIEEPIDVTPEEKAAKEAVDKLVEAANGELTTEEAVKDAEDLVAPAEEAVAKVQDEDVKAELNDKVKNAKDLIETAKEKLGIEDAKVESVSAINAEQFEVKFNKKVDKKLAESLSNYEIKDETITSVLGGNAKAELQEDGETVIVTRAQSYGAPQFNQKELTVKIQNIKTEDGKTIPTYEGKITLFDNVAPELTNVNQVSPTEFDVVFSEPVTAASVTALNSALRINNGAYSFTAKTRTDDTKLAPNIIRVITNATLAEGKYTLTIKDGLTDYAGFKVATGDHEFTVAKDTSEITASVTKVTKNKVYVEFNKPVKNFDDSNVKFNLDYSTNDAFKATSVVADPDNEKGIIVSFAQPVTPQSHNLILSYADETKKKIEDSYENKLVAQTLSFSVLPDNVAPTAKAEYNKDTKKIEVTFSETVQGADAIDAYELVDTDGNKVNVSEVTVKPNTNNLVYELTTSKALEGTYIVKILGDKIKDESFEENKLVATSLNIGVADSTAPVVGKITYGGKDNNKIFVPFSEAMKTSGEGSILDKTLYKINNQELSSIEGAKLELGNDNKSVIITLPTVGSAIGKNVTIGRVADVSDNYTGFVAVSNASTTNDGVISVLQGYNSSDSDSDKPNRLDVDVIAAGKNIQIIDDKTAVFYLDRTITAVDASKIKVNGVAANSVAYNNVNVKLADGSYTTVAKVIATFADETFNTDATITAGSFNIDADAFVTSLGTSSDAPSLTPALEDKAAPVVAKSSTDLDGNGKNDDDDVIATGSNGQVNTITVELSEGMKAVSATGKTAAALVSVDGYEVTGVSISNDGDTTLTIDVKPVDPEIASQTPTVTLNNLEDQAGNVLCATTKAFDNTAASASGTILNQTYDENNYTAFVRVDFTEAMNAEDIKNQANYSVKDDSSSSVSISSVGSNNKYVVLKVTGPVGNKLTASSKVTILQSVKDANKFSLGANNLDVNLTLAN